MRILYISQYFPPEAGATQARAYEMARYLVQKGHIVTMIAEFPNHPGGVIHPSYHGKLFERVLMDGIDVIRVWVKTSTVKNLASRMFFYMSFSLGATLAGSLIKDKFDLIYTTSPPLSVGLTGLSLSYLHRYPLIFEVRDLWPESAVAMGELNNPIAIHWATKLEEACYQRAVRVVVVTPGLRECLLERGIPREKVVVIENGANVDLFQFRPEMRWKLRQSLGLEGKFVVVYAGIIGLAQGLEVVVQTAEILQYNTDVEFLLIGDGPKKAELQGFVQRLRLRNLRFLPEIPRQDVPNYLSTADAALVPLRKREVFHYVVPSKVFDAWSCERAVILGVDGEARHLLESCSGGLFIQPEDPQSLVKAILKLKANEKETIAMGKRGRAFTVAKYSRQALAEKLELVLEATQVSSKSKAQR